MLEYNIWLEGNQQKKKLQRLAKDGNVDISELSIEELIMGMEVEKEHDGRMGKDTDVVGGDFTKVLKITVAHLREDPKYYTKLKKIEGKH